MKNLLVSVSGGKTSMYMMKLLHDKYSATHNILNVFANTGAEHTGWFDTFAKFEDKCSSVKAPDAPRIFFRGKNTVKKIFEMANVESIESFVDDKFFPFDPNLGVYESCSHDCSMT